MHYIVLYVLLHMCIELPNGHHMHKHYTTALFMHRALYGQWTAEGGLGSEHNHRRSLNREKGTQPHKELEQGIGREHSHARSLS